MRERGGQPSAIRSQGVTRGDGVYMVFFRPAVYVTVANCVQNARHRREPFGKVPIGSVFMGLGVPSETLALQLGDSADRGPMRET